MRSTTRANYQGCSTLSRKRPVLQLICNLGAETVFSGILAFFWDDLNDFGTGEFIRHRSIGSAGGRVFQMHFRNRLLVGTCGTDAISAVISIHEGSNLVSVQYDPMSSCLGMRGASATLGIQSANAGESVLVGYNAPVLDHTATRQSMSFKPQ